MSPEQKKAKAQRLRDLQSVFKHCSDDRNPPLLGSALPDEVQLAADRLAELDGSQAIHEIFRNRALLAHWL